LENISELHEVCRSKWKKKKTSCGGRNAALFELGQCNQKLCPKSYTRLPPIVEKESNLKNRPTNIPSIYFTSLFITVHLLHLSSLDQIKKQKVP